MMTFCASHYQCCPAFDHPLLTPSCFDGRITAEGMKPFNARNGNRLATYSARPDLGGCHPSLDLL